MRCTADCVHQTGGVCGLNAPALAPSASQGAYGPMFECLSWAWDEAPSHTVHQGGEHHATASTASTVHTTGSGAVGLPR